MKQKLLYYAENVQIANFGGSSKNTSSSIFILRYYYSRWKVYVNSECNYHKLLSLVFVDNVIIVYNFDESVILKSYSSNLINNYLRPNLDFLGQQLASWIIVPDVSKMLMDVSTPAYNLFLKHDRK